MHPDSLSSSPITAAEFDAAMAPFAEATGAGVVVACSGGPDSIALAVLAHDWARRRGVSCAAVSVNHGLRPEARMEAERVAESLTAHGIPTDALHYDGPVPGRDIQAAAREIRYRLIADWIAARNGGVLLLAHHQDDQAETVLLRLGRGSGVDGLSAMAPLTRRDGLVLLRPLLGFPKSRLAASAAASGLPLVRDPSNGDDAFARVRMRKLRHALAAEGMTPKRLAETAARMARARDALEAARDQFFATLAAPDPAGFVTFPPKHFRDLPEEVGLRVLSQAVRILGGRAHPPRESYLIALHRAIHDDSLGNGRTLAGTKVSLWRGRILVCREGAAIEAPVAVRDGSLWDSRFVLRVADGPGRAGAGEWQVGALGRDGVSEIRRSAPDALNALPGSVRHSIPAVRRDGRIVSVPHVGYRSVDAVPQGAIAFRAVSRAWGEDFQRPLPFSNPVARPM